MKKTTEREALDAIAESVEEYGPMAGAYCALCDAVEAGMRTVFDVENGYMALYSASTLEAVWIDVEAGRVASREPVPRELLRRVAAEAVEEEDDGCIDDSNASLAGLGPFEGPRWFDTQAFLASFHEE